MHWPLSQVSIHLRRTIEGTSNISVIKLHSFPYYSLILPYVFDRSGQSSEKNMKIEFQISKYQRYKK